MTIRIEDTTSGQEQLLDDGTTLEDIIHALGWVKRERARQAAKYRRCVKPRTEAKKAKAPTSSLAADADPTVKRPPGRPRKTPTLPADPML